MNQLLLLCRNPEAVMVCLLLQGSPGITKDLTIRNIQHILLKAFCAENRINTVQVAVDLSFLRFVCQLAGRSAEVAAGDKTDGADYNLILIEVSSVIIVYVQSQSPNIFCFIWYDSILPLLCIFKDGAFSTSCMHRDCTFYCFVDVS